MLSKITQKYSTKMSQYWELTARIVSIMVDDAQIRMPQYRLPVSSTESEFVIKWATAGTFCLFTARYA